MKTRKILDDKTIQKKLNQLVKIANELDREARKRWPNSGAGLFFESDGHFHMMSGDINAGTLDRQKFIKFTSDGWCSMGAGAW